MNKPLTLFLLVLIGTFLFANVASAAIPNWGTGGLVTCSGAELEGKENPLKQCTSFCDILATAKNIFEFIVTLAVLVAAPVFLLIGGIMLAAGGANPGLHSKGAAYLKTAVIGTVIVLLAYALVNTFVTAIDKDGKFIKGFGSPLQCDFNSSGSNSGND